MQPPPISERDECLDPETLAAYVDGLLAHDAIERADRHIDHCRTCRGELSALAATTSFPMGSASPPLPDLDQMPIVEGTLGRYRVEREIGRGNMGVVVRAYDPELARAVAIKILAPKWAHGRDARERLRREAQAMARLSHPNVVQVYDVTSQGELLAIAMELVEGTTLRDAIAAGKSWQMLLAICISAGRGLVAAHAAKLIHRDYKPENVLCATDGRVVVSDFGLARLDDVVPQPPADASATTTTLAGTPAYIAPELLRGEPATIASDQFSFCVATYEALYGERPFAGGKLDELRANMANDSVRPAPVGSPIPIAIRSALLRGLAADPNRRFPSMEALLEALDVRPPSKWSRPRLVLVAAILGALVALVLIAVRRNGPSCNIEPFAWNRAALTDPRVLAAADAYTTTWAGARREACEATHVRKELSESVLDLRNACLDRARREFVELLALGGPTVDAIAKLHDPRSCTPDASAGATSPELDRASALLAAGRTQEALDTAVRVLAGTPSPAARAEALFIRGRAENLLEKFDLSEASLTEAINAGEQAHANHAVAQAWVELVQVTGAQNHRFEAAQANMRAAEAVFARVDPGPALRARYGYVVGAMLLARGSLDEAEKYLERGLVSAETKPADLGIIQGALCDLYRQRREIAKARAACTKAVEILSATFGPDHQKLGVLENVWGTVELFDRKHAAARTHWQRTIAILEKLNMTQDRAYALAFNNIGVSWSEQGDIEQAQPAFERARDLFAKHHPKHVQRMLPLQGLAGVLLQKKDYRGAIAAYEEALAVIEEVYGKDDVRRITLLFNLALTYSRVPELAKAMALADEMITLSERPGREQWSMIAHARDMQAMIVEKQSKDWTRAIELRKQALVALDHKDEPPLRAWIDMEIGRVMRSSGKIKESIEHLDRAVAYYSKDKTDLYVVGTAQYWLGKSLWESGGDKKRAVALVQQARSDLDAVKTGLNIEIHRQQVADWLAKHR